MPIARSELKQYKSSVVDETTTNGNIMGSTSIVSNVLNNVFPDVSKADRLAGLTTHRKTFVKNTNLSLALLSPVAWIDSITQGDDNVVLFAGTQRDTFDDIVGDERKFGCASLQADADSGASVIVVTVEDVALAVGNDAIFAAADTIRITNKSNIDSGIGTEEEFLIDSIVTPFEADDTRIQITLDTNALANDYTVAGTTRVMSIYKHGSSLDSSADAGVETSPAGTFDDTTYPTVTSNIGTYEDDITITFTSATEFGVESTTYGTLAAGIITSDYTHNSTVHDGSIHFTIPKEAWGGTWASDDTLEVTLHPAAMPLWRKRVVPASSGSLSGNKTVLVFGGESV